MVTGYGNEPGRVKFVAEEDNDDDGEKGGGGDEDGANVDVFVEVVFDDEGSRVYPRLEGRVQIWTRNRVCDHVHLTTESDSVDPPSLSSGDESTALPLRGAREARNIDLSKYV